MHPHARRRGFHAEGDPGNVTVAIYMSSSTPPLALFAIVAPGLEALAAAELRALGARGVVEERGGVRWGGDLRSLQRANLASRTVSRVVVRAARFHASSFHELERRARRVAWAQWIAPGTPVQVRVTAHKSRLYHSDAVAERLVAAAVATGAVPGAGTPDADPFEPGAQRFLARLDHDELVLSVDSSGALLHRRGYRQAVARAPLRETLAAAMLLASGYDGGAPLVDPLCGSGTIAIEGALLARRIPPGHARAFAFMRWPGFDARAWEATRGELLAGVLPHAPAPIVASDRDAGAVAAARANADRAGVGADVAIRAQALSAAAPPANDGDPGGGPPGWLVTNPPYGVRVGADVRDLHARLGQLARGRFAGWRLGVLTSDPGGLLARQIGGRLETAFRTENGGIPVQYLTGAGDASDR